jgi:predicted 2-oxoglutarate/Fe(II)-dependent dioxygenase YbiX
MVYCDSAFLDAVMCGRVRAAMDRGVHEPAEVLLDDTTVDNEGRRASSIDIDAAIREMVEHSLDTASAEIAGFFSIPLVEREGASFLRYDVGGFYKPHRDHSMVESWPAAARRRIAVVVFLNNASSRPAPDEFSGGELRLLEGPAAPVDILPRRGMLVAFPATTPHEVLPVRRGRRDTMVDWFY